jgi:hypothetical protein
VIRDVYRSFNPNIDPAVRCVLVAASSDTRNGTTLCSKFGSSQSEDEGAQIGVAQAADVIARDFEHEPETASPFRISLSRKRKLINIPSVATQAR